MSKKKEVDKGRVKVYGMDNCPACKMVQMMLKDKNIEFDYIDLENDDFMRDRLLNKVGDFSIPKIEYGDNILNYSAKSMEKIFEDLA